MSRLSSLSDSTGTLASFKYLGLEQIVEKTDGGDALSYLDSYGNVTGLDRFGRVVDQVWKDAGNNILDKYTYTYDREGNRTSQTNVLDQSARRDLRLQCAQ